MALRLAANSSGLTVRATPEYKTDGLFINKEPARFAHTREPMWEGPAVDPAAAARPSQGRHLAALVHFAPGGGADRARPRREPSAPVPRHGGRMDESPAGPGGGHADRRGGARPRSGSGPRATSSWS